MKRSASYREICCTLQNYKTHLFCSAIGSDKDPDSSLSCSPFIDNLHSALNMRKASLCIIEGKAMVLLPACAASLAPITVAVFSAVGSASDSIKADTMLASGAASSTSKTSALLQSKISRRKKV